MFKKRDSSDVDGRVATWMPRPTTTTFFSPRLCDTNAKASLCVVHFTQRPRMICIHATLKTTIALNYFTLTNFTQGEAVCFFSSFSSVSSSLSKSFCSASVSISQHSSQWAYALHLLSATSFMASGGGDGFPGNFTCRGSVSWRARNGYYSSDRILNSELID